MNGQWGLSGITHTSPVPSFSLLSSYLLHLALLHDIRSVGGGSDYVFRLKNKLKKYVYITRTCFDCSDKISCVNDFLAGMRVLPIGRFSVILRARSRERSQRHFRADFRVGIASRCV